MGMISLVQYDYTCKQSGVPAVYYGGKDVRWTPPRGDCSRMIDGWRCWIDRNKGLLLHVTSRALTASSDRRAEHFTDELFRPVNASCFQNRKKKTLPIATSISNLLINFRDCSIAIRREFFLTKNGEFWWIYLSELILPSTKVISF